MIKFISAIDESIVQAVNCYLLENILQECTVEIETETGQCFLCGYYDDVETGKKFFQDIKNVFPNIGDIKCQEINNTDWENEYKKYCKPWNFKYIDWVPLWLKDEIKPREGVEPVYIDSFFSIWNRDARNYTFMCQWIRNVLHDVQKNCGFVCKEVY